MAAELEAELPAFDRGLLECSAEEIAAVRARSGRGRAAGSGQPGGTLMAGSFLPSSLPPVPGIEGLRRARAGGVRGCWGGELVGEIGIKPVGLRALYLRLCTRFYEERFGSQRMGALQTSCSEERFVFASGVNAKP